LHHPPVPNPSRTSVRAPARSAARRRISAEPTNESSAMRSSATPPGHHQKHNERPSRTVGLQLRRQRPRRPRLRIGPAPHERPRRLLVGGIAVPGAGQIRRIGGELAGRRLNRRCGCERAPHRIPPSPGPGRGARGEAFGGGAFERPPWPTNCHDGSYTGPRLPVTVSPTPLDRSLQCQPDQRYASLGWGEARFGCRPRRPRLVRLVWVLDS
jgi:hypothetical protein